MNKKIAMFGGSFNPIHNGHIKLAERCIDEAGLDEVIVVPTFTTPIKDNRNMISAEHRYNMCKLACKNHFDLVVSDIEIKRGGNSYTFDTLSELQTIYSNDSLFLIVGADMFLTLQKWKNPESIFKIATIIACPRDENDYGILKKHSNLLKNLGAKTIILQNSVMVLSSSIIRDKIKHNENVSDFISSDVLEYIKINNLYRL